jgi:uncharacterized protein YfaQ (DUF2300 family)
MRRFEIHLPEERLEALEARAHKVGIPTAAMAKVAITEWLEDLTAKQRAEPRAEAA